MTQLITYETERDLQIENTLVAAKGEGGWEREGLRVWD